MAHKFFPGDDPEKSILIEIFDRIGITYEEVQENSSLGPVIYAEIEDYQINMLIMEVCGVNHALEGVLSSALPSIKCN